MRECESRHVGCGDLDPKPPSICVHTGCVCYLTTGSSLSAGASSWTVAGACPWQQCARHSLHLHLEVHLLEGDLDKTEECVIAGHSLN